MGQAVLALNAGSSSVKFGLYESDPGDPHLLLRGAVESDPPHLKARAADGTMLHDGDLAAGEGEDALFRGLLDWIAGHLGGEGLLAAGHRIVHGGRDFAEPVRLTPDIVAALEALTPLAPLHQPRSLAAAHALTRLRPDLPQIGCFDTAFHHHLEPPVSRFGLPRRFEQEGVRRYGFHGLSYEFIASRLREVAPEIAGGRVVVAHLGNGASLCAIRDGRSVDTTMGFSALDGLVMGTRCGALDPGVLLYLQQAHGLSTEALEDLLYRQSGLLGVSGISGDVRVLLGSDDPRAAEALDLFAFRIVRETAALAATLGGLDAFVFTAGIGENAAPVRVAVCERLAWLGITLDPAANRAGREVISTPRSTVAVRVMPTDEELTIARHAAQVLRGGKAGVTLR